MVGESNTALERFEHLLDVHGSDPAGWPASDREWARALVAADPAAATLHAESRALDDALGAVHAPAPSAELYGAVMAAAPSSDNGPRRLFAWLWPFGPAWQPATAFALAIMVGLFVGMQFGPTGGDEIGVFDVAGLEELAGVNWSVDP